ncbi:uncharacterized protein [Amphiura filiformis]|uniref:uncharacterized protein n=1 Tax=Amphiura filiformis TaxID=82378 RepID=UPI003B2152B8
MGIAAHYGCKRKLSFLDMEKIKQAQRHAEELAKKQHEETQEAQRHAEELAKKQHEETQEGQRHAEELGKKQHEETQKGQRHAEELAKKQHEETQEGQAGLASDMADLKQGQTDVAAKVADVAAKLEDIAAQVAEEKDADSKLRGEGGNKTQAADKPIDEWINDITEELKKHYQGHVCKKWVYPWGGNWMDFDKIYIPVTIDRDVGPESKPIKESLESYEELFEIKEDEASRRFILVGDPGQGKSSFCAKVAHDWCVRKTLENIRLLFIIDLAKVDKDTFIEDAICEHLLSDIEIQPTKLREVIKHLKQSIFFIFDGLVPHTTCK